MNREFFVKEREVSDPRYGNYPGTREFEGLLERGLVLIDKPGGPTSHQVTAWVKDILGVEKAGHSGTLDPKTSGVLLIALQKSTKVMPVLKDLDKEYVTVVTLHEDIEEKRMKENLDKFRGEIAQIPPKKSAVKREERKREIKELELLEKDGRNVLLRIKCEAGTYIRKLAHDLGDELECGAHMKELRRTRIGPFTEEETTSLGDLKDNFVFYQEGESDRIKKLIFPVEKVADLSKVLVVKDTAVEAICNGAPLGVGGISRVEKGIEEGEIISLLSGKGELIAIGEAEMSAEEMDESKEGKAVSLINVIMERGTYPKAWKQTD